jgi:hypothetical protein
MDRRRGKKERKKIQKERQLKGQKEETRER